MREEVLANRMALEQLGHYEDNERDYDDDYQESLFQSRIRRGNYGQIVDDIASDIAKSALSSRGSAGRTHEYYKENGSSIWAWVKAQSEKPWIRESFLIGSVALLKMALYFAYRRAGREGIPEIADL